MQKYILIMMNQQKLIEDYNIILQLLMEYQSNKKPSSFAAIHKQNVDLYEAGNKRGMVGERQSRLIDKLIAKKQALQNKKSKQNSLVPIQQPQNFKQLRQKIQSFTIQQEKLKGQMLRLCQISKEYKMDKKQCQQKYKTLNLQYQKSKEIIKQLELKIQILSQLNNLLIEINANIQPLCKINCNDLFQSINQVKKKFDDGNHKEVIDNLTEKLSHFKKQIQTIKHNNLNLMTQLENINYSTKNINHRLSCKTSIDQQEIYDLYQGFNKLRTNHLIEGQLQRSRHIKNSKLGLNSSIISWKLQPGKQSKVHKVFTNISLLFQQQIHLLEAQKMEFQFTKNKKLISFQKFQCEICENYERIMSTIFSIVREAFKQIKFQFLREIKQLDNVDEVTLLI